VGLTVQRSKSLTPLGNFTEGIHSTIANVFTGVLEQINNMRDRALNCLDKFRWRKGIKRGARLVTVQMTKSLTLLGNFNEGSHSRMAIPRSRVLDHINDIRHHSLNFLDKFRWKKESRGWPAA